MAEKYEKASSFQNFLNLNSRSKFFLREIIYCEISRREVMAGKYEKCL